jgi:hypothetical protein
MMPGKKPEVGQPAMNDHCEPDNDADDKRKQLIGLFLRRTQAEVEQMRRSVPRLIGGDQQAWQELRFYAQRINGQAAGLELGVLSACARELARLTDEKFASTELDADFLLSATSAIEMVAIELNELLLQSG